MNFIEFKKSYQEISKSIHGLDNIKDNTSVINDARRAIKANADIIKNGNRKLADIDRAIKTWDKTKKQSEFEKFLEEQNKHMRETEKEIEEANKNIAELQNYIDEWNNENKTKRDEANRKKAEKEADKGNVRKNAEKQYNDELSKLNTEYEALRQQKNAEKEEFRKKHGDTYAELSGRKNLTKEEMAVLNRIKEEEKAIDKKYLGLLKGKHNEILKLKNDYEELKESFEKIDKNPEIEGKEIGLPEEKKAPEEQKPVKKRPAEEPAVEEPVVEEPVAEEPATEEPAVEEPVVEEPVAEEPVAEEPATEEPAAEEPVVEEPVVEEPAAEEPVAEEPAEDFITEIRKIIGDQESPETQPVAEEPAAEELTDDDMIDIDELFDTEKQVEEMPGFGSRDEKEKTHKKVSEIHISRDNEYSVIYKIMNENGKNSVENLDLGKIGLFKRMKERVKLILKRNEYGISFKTVFKADPGVLRVLNDKELSEDYREEYLKALEGKAVCPIEIKYKNVSNKYFKALDAGQIILGLNKGRDEGRRSLNERFGEGFDQHKNPPIVDDRTADEPATGDHEQSVDEMDQDL